MKLKCDLTAYSKPFGEPDIPEAIRDVKSGISKTNKRRVNAINLRFDITNIEIECSVEDGKPCNLYIIHYNESGGEPCTYKFKDISRSFYKTKQYGTTK
jgi:hypothetical protein